MSIGEAYDALREAGPARNADRRLLRDAWEHCEVLQARDRGVLTTPELATVRAKTPVPRAVRRPVIDPATGAPAGLEEVIEYAFPDDQASSSAKGWAAILARARDQAGAKRQRDE
jgi:hypothetical protein